VLELAPNLALAHALLGLLQINTKRVKEGIFQCEQAIALDKNLANGWGIMSYGKQLLGYAEQCESDVVEALRLSPRDIFAFRWLHNVGVAKLLVGDDAGAIGWFRRSLDVNRNYAIAHFHLAAALGLIGELEQARTVARTAATLDQNFTIRRFRLGTATDNPTYLAGRERIYEGMRIAGLPEG
jgi:tetratricopeptide (TPR) repeat protein